MQLLERPNPSVLGHVLCQVVVSDHPTHDREDSTRMGGIESSHRTSIACTCRFYELCLCHLEPFMFANHLDGAQPVRVAR